MNKYPEGGQLKKQFAYLNTLETSRKFRTVQKDDERDKDQ